MSGARIDRLTLDAGAMGATDARALVLKVAAGLADAQLGPVNIPMLRISVEGGVPASELAEKIIADILRQLRRVP
jgi:hypothetical protein